MRKIYSSEFYPLIKDKQFDFHRAVIPVLNVSKYLHAEDFSTGKYSWLYLGGGKIVFPDASVISSDDFQFSRDVNSLLEKVLVEKGKLISDGSFFYSGACKDGAVTLNLNKSLSKTDKYKINLNIAYTNDRKYTSLGAIMRKILNNEKLFSFHYDIELEKEKIDSADISQFNEYVDRIRTIARFDTQVDLSAFNIQKENSENTKGSKNDLKTKTQKSLESSFNPWDIEIPSIENKVMSR